MQMYEKSRALPPAWPLTTKILLIMKLTMILLTVACLQAGAAGYAQRISLSEHNAPLEKIFRQIKKQTGYNFFFEKILVQDKVNIQVSNATIEEALDRCLKGLPLTYAIVDKIVVIKRKVIAGDPVPVVAPQVPVPIMVTGKVIDSVGKPLEGVSVTIVGAPGGTSTNAGGEFTIAVEPNARLHFSYIGFEVRDVPVKNRTSITVTLKLLPSSLNDVVIIGYGSTRRRDVTAAVSTVSKDALTDRTLFSLADAMKGKAAGVQITQNDGTPGSANTIRIRGASSISGGSTPLYVIDGIMQDDANNLNPGDIESIEILKDASGTAIYGARGANGVVMITTKTGKAGKTRLELYSNVGMQRPGHLVDLMDASEYAHARYLASSYVYSPSSAGDPNQPANTQVGYTYFRDRPLDQSGGGFWGVALDQTYHNWQNYNHPDSNNTDWQKAMFQNSAVQEYRIAVTGGSKDTKFALLGGYLDQGGLVVYSGYKRYNGRFNLQQKLATSLTLTANISGTRTETDGFISGSLNGGVNSNAVVTSMLQQPPIKPLTFTDIEDNEGVDGYISTNPYSLAQKVTNNRYTSDWITRLALDWNLTRNFSFRTTGNYSAINTNTDAYYPKNTVAGAKYGGRAVLSRGQISKFMNENLLYYKGSVNTVHNFNAMAGAIFEVNKNNLVTAENQNYDKETLGAYGLSNGTVPIIPTYTITKWSMASFLSRLEYNYRGKYLATLTMRADGSSRFSSNNKWGYFPSAAVAWRVSDEPFMTRLQFVNNLKLRASIGQSGNTAIPPYLTLSTISTYFSPMDGNTPDFGVVIERPENRSLKWETTTQVNGGIDLLLFNEKLTITADWYLKRTKDLLIQRVTPGYSGYRSTWTNLGSVQNSGIEISAGTRIMQKGKFGWSIDANIGFNRSKAIDVGPDLNLDPQVVAGIGTTAIIRNGEPIGQWFGYQTDGIFQSPEEIQKSGLTMINGQAISAIRPGTRRFIDQTGDGIINAADRVILGKGQPDFVGGVTNTFSYLGFNLTVLVQYSYGNKIYNANRVALEAGRTNNNMTKGPADAWRPSLYDMNTGALFEEGNPGNRYRMPGSPEELLMLSDWIENGTFVRLSDVTLSYGLTNRKLRKIGVEGLSFFVSGKNLAVWTNYSGYDPEVNTRQGGFGDLMPSLDYASYPRSRVYSFGIKAQF
jgi:TonB-linked SusC/RagA family outer membrane protein